MDLDDILDDNLSSISDYLESMSMDVDVRPDPDSLLARVKWALEMGTDVDVFAIGGTIPMTAPKSANNDTPYIKSPIIIRWDSDDFGHGRKISLPIPENDIAQEAFAQLLADYEPPTFGIGDHDLFTDSYFNAREMDSSKFSTNFNLSDYGVIGAVSQALTHSVRSKRISGLGSTKEVGIAEVAITAHLRSLNVHSAPCENFERHFDKAQLVNQMGLLIVCLPEAHQGGQLLIHHGQRDASFDWAHEKADSVRWAAFFTDCGHKISPVTQGNRITLTYSLCWTLNTPTRMADQFSILNPRSMHFYRALETLLDDQKFLPGAGHLGFVCKHAYPHTSKSSIENLHRSLKGLDMMVFQAFHDLKLKPTVTAILDDEHYRHPATERGETPDESDPEYRSECHVTVPKILHPVIHWHKIATKSKESPNPHIIPENIVNSTADEETILFSRKKVIWLNHMPGDKEHTELAVTFPLTKKGSGGVGTYVSRLVILAPV